MEMLQTRCYGILVCHNTVLRYEIDTQDIIQHMSNKLTLNACNDYYHFPAFTFNELHEQYYKCMSLDTKPWQPIQHGKPKKQQTEANA
jgi:hypothetical protein